MINSMFMCYPSVTTSEPAVMRQHVSQHQCLDLWPPTSLLRRYVSASVAETHRSASLDMVKCVPICKKDQPFICARVCVWTQNHSSFCLSAEPQLNDLSSDRLKKLRVLELRNILASWGEECRGCLEKHEFVSLIQEKAPLHAPSTELWRVINPPILLVWTYSDLLNFSLWCWWSLRCTVTHWNARQSWKS